MSLNQWRKFAFFDKKIVKNESGEPFDALKPYKIWASSSGRGKLFFGDADGVIIVMDQRLEVFTFRAHLLRVSHLCMMKQQNFLVSVGDDDGDAELLIKVWNFDKMDASGTPTCARIIRLPAETSREPVTCFTVHENLNYMAIGYSNGSVVLFKGDITKERNASKHIQIHKGKSPITGLSFRPTTTGKGGIALYISSLDEIWSYAIGSRDKESESILDHHGCALQCSTMTDSTVDFQFVIGRSDAFYFYLPDSRGQCLAFGGEKVLLEWCHGYLVVVSKKDDSDGRASSSDSLGGDMQIITIYDVKNKLIAYYGPVQEVKALLCEWGSVFVLCNDNKLFQIKEKELVQKLDMLFRKNLYSLAISLAKAQHYDQDALVDMFRQYADHLYSKGDFDEAMSQYIKTIGRLEPSYVIRQFLDAQRIHNLTAYLSALHECNLASEDHTTLLLNCYTKLKDVEQLDRFIMKRSANKAVSFDIETAIRVLRQSGYFKHALYLSELHQKHDWYLRIQLEDNKDYRKALDYMAKLEFAAVEANMRTYGKMLMSNVSLETTELLKRLCSNYGTDTNSDGEEIVLHANPEDYFHIFITHSEEMRSFLECVLAVRSDLAPELHNTLLGLYLESYKKCTADVAAAKERAGLEEKIMDFLRGTEPRNYTQALLQCQMNNFAPGILFLYEQKAMYGEILQFAVDRKSYDGVISTCRRFGEKDPQLWVQAFWFYASNFGEYDKALIGEVLKVIEKLNLLQPMMVVDILAKNPNATLDTIRDYIIRRMHTDERKILEDEAQVQKYREKTEKIRKEVDLMKSGAQTFQDANCSACDKSLELPSVHFLCRHSYHQHCFESYAENDECPACRPENRKILDEIKTQEQSKDLTQQFMTRLGKENDAFSVVADYFGKGLFGRNVSIDDLIRPNGES
ncbi:Vacuolar protein sorting-associated protein 11-like protein [Hypsibius exemplaris]|uniref:Vacuolar protein sorting-associated protein 11 homolog n=1 Tax=Hypsibius exemplaris TaxID=2072580 RepID=A0A9X6RKI4_HYPEX|nr:Vacuolar protein sorting-associated protein 11-like protein [Hypsibius exemplaris]